jgi:hypothetical protein
MESVAPVNGSTDTIDVFASDMTPSVHVKLQLGD